MFRLLFICLFLSGVLLQAQESDIRIKNQLDRMELYYEYDSQGNFKLLFELPEQRTQLVYISSTTTKYEDVEVRQIYSPVLVLNDIKQLSFQDLHMLLTESAQTIFGGWQILPHRQGWVVSFAVKVPALMPENRLRMYLWYVAQIADQMEKRFSADDNL